MRLAGLFALPLVVACDPTARVGDGSVTEATRASVLSDVASAARRCWFAGDPRFASFALLDEQDSRSQRLLVVKRSNPTGRPSLVVEVDGTDALQVYGPLADPNVKREVQAFARSRGRRCT